MLPKSMVYEPLVKYRADGSVQYGWQTLASSPTEKARLVHLRDDVAFSSDEPFNARAAAAANFQVVLCNRQHHAQLELITK